MNYFLLLITGLLSTYCYSQNSLEQLISDPNILWIGETYIDIEFHEDITSSSFLMDNLPKYSNKAQLGKHQLLKYSIPVPQYRNYEPLDHNIIPIIQNQRTSEQFIFFQDDNLTVPLTAEQQQLIGMHLDTITAFDIETFEEIAEVWMTDLLTTKHNGYFLRIKQWIYFDQIHNTFNVLPFSASPIIYDYDANGNLLGSSPTSWFPIYTTNIFPDLNSSDITWAKRNYITCNTIDIPEKKVTISRDSTMRYMLSQIKTNPNNYLIYNEQDSLMSLEEIKQIEQITRDSLVYVPEGFHGNYTMRLKENIMYSRDMQKISFVMIWYWDEKQSKLFAYTEIVEPMVEIQEVLDFEEIHIYSKPLYYQYLENH